MNDSSTLHIPLEPAIRREFTAKAKQLGFDSAQAYLRVIIKATVDGRRIDLDVDSWSDPSEQAVKRLQQAAAVAKTGEDISTGFTSTEDFMKEL